MGQKPPAPGRQRCTLLVGAREQRARERVRRGDGLRGSDGREDAAKRGNEPETDREMFQELGLNVARQADNASNPRPDNRSGWLAGETPDVVEDLLGDTARVQAPDAIAAESGLTIRLWDPSTQLRFHAKRSVPPRPDGAPNRTPSARRTAKLHAEDVSEDSAAPSPVATG